MKKTLILLLFSYTVLQTYSQDTSGVFKDEIMALGDKLNEVIKYPIDSFKKITEECFILYLVVEDSVVRKVDALFSINSILKPYVIAGIQKLVNTYKLKSIEHKQLTILLGFWNISQKKENRPPGPFQNGEFERLSSALKNYGLFMSLQIVKSAGEKVQ